MNVKIDAVDFGKPSAAVAVERWPMAIQTQNLSGRVSVQFSGVVTASGRPWPNDDLRLCEQQIIDLVHHRLSTFEALERERNSLKAQLESLIGRISE